MHFTSDDVLLDGFLQSKILELKPSDHDMINLLSNMFLVIIRL